MKVFAKRAYLMSDWEHNVRLTICDDEIFEIETSVQAGIDDICVDTLLPALSNLHSHSFQRAMAGMTEFRAKGRDSFWTWRDLMYRFLDHLTPDQIGAIAALAFMEMQTSGYAAVGEFHYIHHAPGGQAYGDRAELSNQIMEAAKTTGIGLTHLPVLYSYGDVGQHPLAGGQFRFGNTVDQFGDLVDRCKSMAASHNPDTRVGIAPHSLRATSPGDLARIRQIHGDGPIHIHIAEQTKEIESVQAVLGARPVEWLLDNADPHDKRRDNENGQNWCSRRSVPRDRSKPWRRNIQRCELFERGRGVWHRDRLQREHRAERRIAPAGIFPAIETARTQCAFSKRRVHRSDVI